MQLRLIAVAHPDGWVRCFQELQVFDSVGDAAPVMSAKRKPILQKPSKSDLPPDCMRSRFPLNGDKALDINTPRDQPCAACAASESGLHKGA